MKIRLKINKSIDANAEEYFLKAKKFRKKLKGAVEALEKTKQKLKNKKKEIKLEFKKRIVHKRNWFEHFHWSFTRNGFLIVGGRDASSNETLIKKYLEKNDLVLHTDMAGSPFVIIKFNECLNKNTISKINKQDLEDAADFLLAYSRAWKFGFGNADIFYIKPDQISKEANTGEFLKKGSFVIRGKTTYIANKIDFCIGIYKDKFFKDKVFVGNEVCAKIYSQKFFHLVPGKMKTSDIAKTVKQKTNSMIELDEFIRAIPSNSELKLK